MILALIGECHAELPGCVQRVEFCANKKRLKIGLVHAVQCCIVEVRNDTVQWKLVWIFEQCRKILWRLPDRQGLEIWAGIACQLQNSWVSKGELRYVQIWRLRLPGYLTHKDDGLPRDLKKQGQYRFAPAARRSVFLVFLLLTGVSNSPDFAPDFSDDGGTARFQTYSRAALGPRI